MHLCSGQFDVLHCKVWFSDAILHLESKPDLQNRFIHSVSASALSCGAILPQPHFLMHHFLLLRRPHPVATHHVTITLTNPLSSQRPWQWHIIVPAVPRSLLRVRISASQSLIDFFSQWPMPVFLCFAAAIQLAQFIIWPDKVFTHSHQQNTQRQMEHWLKISLPTQAYLVTSYNNSDEG